MIDSNIVTPQAKDSIYLIVFLKNLQIKKLGNLQEKCHHKIF